MKGALASKINKSSKYNLPNYNRKGAYGQAKYAGNLGQQASYADSGAGAKTTALQSFEGETAGEGDLNTPDMGGEGLGGGGISDGDGLKGSDPSLNSNSSTPPPEPEPPVEDSPWAKYEDMALYGGLAWMALYLIAKMMAKSQTPWMKAAAVYFAYAAAAAAAVVIAAGVMLMKGDPDGDPAWEGQKWMGMMYLAMGGYMLYMSIEAISGMTGDDGAEKVLAEKAATTSAGGEAVAGEAAKQGSTGIGTIDASLNGPGGNIPPNAC